MRTTRKYELRKRAERMEATRRRITEAAMELHRTVGPAATRISDVARRAGVQRITVYDHFPDEAALFAACSAHWRALHPAPAIEELVSDEAGVAGALRALYRWYRETEPMTANVLRDAALLPALRSVVDGGLGRYLETSRKALSHAVATDGAARERTKAAIRAATDFHFWRALAPLGDDEAAALGAALVAAAVSSPRAPRAATRSPSPAARRSSPRRAG